MRPKVCPNCTRKHCSAKRKLCQICRAKSKQRSNERYREACGEGLCAVCRKLERHDDYSMCEVCLNARRGYWVARRERAREQGKCLLCLFNPMAEGYVRCEPCLAKRRRWRRKANAKANKRVFDGDKRIMESLEIADDPMTLIELAKRSGVTTRTVLRWMRRLVPSGRVIVEQEEGAGFSGVKLYRMGRNG